MSIKDFVNRIGRKVEGITNPTKYKAIEMAVELNQLYKNNFVADPQTQTQIRLYFDARENDRFIEVFLIDKKLQNKAATIRILNDIAKPKVPLTPCQDRFKIFEVDSQENTINQAINPVNNYMSRLRMVLSGGDS